MANKISIELFPGASDLDPGAFLGARDRDLRDFQVGAKNASGEGSHNRLAVPWAGAAYTLVEGSWTKIAGRDGALSGDQMESAYGRITSVWRDFATAQRDRRDSPGTYDALVADLRRVASQVSTQSGETDPSQGEGISLRAQKVAAKRGGAQQDLPELPA